ncbi:DUF5958 family protein [Streptomyces sp. NPDC046976]|uniref:DUF5958 family protein n=1 Tax=Streptomyces sp. NPDC046976 TaxID=3155258 RepID=UPI00340870D1
MRVAPAGGCGDFVRPARSSHAGARTSRRGCTPRRGRCTPPPGPVRRSRTPRPSTPWTWVKTPRGHSAASSRKADPSPTRSTRTPAHTANTRTLRNQILGGDARQVALFGVADTRRRRLYCAGGCAHAWHNLSGPRWGAC